MDCTKIILSSLENFDRVIFAIEEEIDERCLRSYDFRTPSSLFAEEILNLIDRKERLILLKKKVDKVISLLSSEEKDLLYCKYCGILPDKPFGFSLRTYFRKQVKLFEKLDEYLSFIGISDERFKEEFESEPFIMCAKIKAEDVKRLKCLFVQGTKKNNADLKKTA